MAKTVKYNYSYILKAYELAERISNSDEIKAAEDLYAVDAVLSGRNTWISPYGLNNRLRKEYKTIGMMEAIADKFAFNDIRPSNVNFSEKDRIMKWLQSDKIGIIVDVLIKHEIIKTVDELCVKLEIGNRNIYMTGI